MINYSLIVSDFDGTLRRDAGGISETNARAIREYISNGGIFAICTGRMMSSILPHAQSLGLESLLIAYQGALILDLKSGKTLRNIHHSAQEAAQICLVMEKMGLHIHVYDGDNFYTNKNDWLLAEYERICGVKGVLAEEDLSSLVLKKNIEPQKVLAMVEPKDRNAVYNKVTSVLGKNFNVTTSSDALVEVTKMGCEKGDAVRFLAEYYNIPCGKVAAIGDNINDIPMIKAAGLGVAVGNAEEALKEVADVVTCTNNEDAVAHIIKIYGMGEMK